MGNAPEVRSQLQANSWQRTLVPDTPPQQVFLKSMNADCPPNTRGVSLDNCAYHPEGIAPGQVWLQKMSLNGHSSLLRTGI
jgi:hypothetical protein